MMTKYSILSNDFDSDLSQLIAIHTDAEDFRLCYLINKFLNLKLMRTAHDLSFKNSVASFSCFEWFDEKQFCSWQLVSNHFHFDIAMGENVGLFANETLMTQTHYLIPEYDKVNFFVKFEEEGAAVDVKSIVSQLHDLPQVMTAYLVEKKSVKSKMNLIFY